MIPRFKPGDRVRRIHGSEKFLTIGEIYTVYKYLGSACIFSYLLIEGQLISFYEGYFELVEDEEEYDTEI